VSGRTVTSDSYKLLAGWVACFVFVALNVGAIIVQLVLFHEGAWLNVIAAFCGGASGGYGLGVWWMVRQWEVERAP
jgi:hypothetical protein